MFYDSYVEEHIAEEHIETLRDFHGKAIALDINDRCAPLPLLFLVHEYMARGRNFYQPTADLEVDDGWQKWLVKDGLVNEKSDGTFTFNRDPPRRSARLQTSSILARPIAGPSDPQAVIKPPTADLVEELLAFQRTMPSWKAWQRETMSWEGTAEENAKKYVENIGVEESAE